MHPQPKQPRFRMKLVLPWWWWCLFFLFVGPVHAKPSSPWNHSTTTQETQARELPPKVIVGYASECNDQVITAVQQGVNVVIWAFYHLSPATVSSSSSSSSSLEKLPPTTTRTRIDLDCIQDMMKRLDQQGFTDTVHLVSLGGWNGPHLDPYFRTATQWYDAWKAMVGHVFHGMDIDFEGNDDLQSPWNYMSLEELDRVGEILTLAKQDGYLVTMSPAQSYLDIHTSDFSHYLNLTDPNRTWHAEFSYFGRNLYAYWVAKYGPSIDLIMIQFYESYSRAAMEITHNQDMTPENYLQQYVWDLNQPPEGPGWKVDFGSDIRSSSGGSTSSSLQHVPLPLSKLVWGFANAWANHDDGGRHLYFPPTTIQAAYQNLWDWMLEPRGMMFWNIASEGEQGIYYARELNEILHIRSLGKPVQEQPLAAAKTSSSTT